MPVTSRTRIVRDFDPHAVRALKDSSTKNLLINGPTLAEHALRLGLVGEIVMYICPVVVGEGLKFLPDGLALELNLVEHRRFASGVVLLRYCMV